MTILQRIASGITGHLSLVLVGALALGLLWQELAAVVQPMMRYGLMLVIYIGFLTVDLGRLKEELKSWRYHLYLLVLLQLAIPALIYVVLRVATSPLPNAHAWSLGMLLVLAAPAGAITPSICLMFNAKFERSLLIVITTSMLVPLTLPLLLRVASGHAMQLPLEPIEAFLTMIVVLPAVAAVLTRRFAPRVVGVIEPRIALLSVLCLSMIIIGSVAGLRDHLTAKPGILAEMVGISAAAFLTAYALGWFAGAKKEWPDRMTVAISATWTNVGLAIVLANEFFREAMPLVVLFTVTASISWNATLVPGQWLASRFDNASTGPAQADSGGRSRHTD
ncbi:MAG: bile acid:sodium symporter [Myxococcota bacterium]